MQSDHCSFSNWFSVHLKTPSAEVVELDGFRNGRSETLPYHGALERTVGEAQIKVSHIALSHFYAGYKRLLAIRYPDTSTLTLKTDRIDDVVTSLALIQSG